MMKINEKKYAENKKKKYETGVLKSERIFARRLDAPGKPDLISSADFSCE